MVGTFSALDLVRVLPVLRGRPHPDVPDHRRVGRAAPRLCELQVLPLHAARLGADAARHHGDVLAGRHDRHPDADEVRLPAGHADLAVARLLRLVRREDADVAGAHLAARRACRGADRGLGDPRRDPPEDGRLRLPALLAADVPARLDGPRAADLRALGHRHRLHLAGRDRAGGHEEADRLLLGRAHGLRHHGHLRADHAGDRGRHLPDDLARARLGRAVPLRRRRLRPPAHARDRRLWRAREHHAGLRLRVPALHAGQCRPARHLRLRRRIPGAARHVQGRTFRSRRSRRSA